MNIVDVLIVILFISALARGAESGLVRQLCSTAGVLGGLLLGAWVQGKLVHLMQTPTSKALLAVCIILAAIAIFSSIGEYIGSALKSRLQQFSLRAIDVTDRGLGSVVAGATLLLAVWLGAAIFSNAPAGAIQRAIRGSAIVAQLDKSLPNAPTVVARLGRLIDPNGFPKVFTGLEPAIDTNKPLPSIGDLDAAVQKDRASVVKVEGEGCGGITDGSGFVASDGLVITNAHVVAGVARPYILDANGRHSTQVIWFDPDLDLAVLRAGGLSGAPLTMQTSAASVGEDAAILGYPGGGDFAADPAVIVDAFTAVGRNIYNQNQTQRSVYSIKGQVIPGNSGGPLVDKDGDVVGVIFAKSTSYDNVGYALAMAKVVSEFDQAKAQNQVVATGSCAE